MTTTSKLSWTHFPAGQTGFFRAPVLLTGPTEALLIDGGFTYPDGRALAEAIKATGKTLTAIYVSQSDPDYYFSLKPVREAFPSARVIAASDTIAAIGGNVEKKLAAWGPQLKENGPQTLADVVLPEAFDGPALTMDGERVDIVAAEGLANRRYLRVPALDAVVGGVLIFSGVHVWTADAEQASPGRLGCQSRQDRGAEAEGGGARPPRSAGGHRPHRRRPHQGLSPGLRGRTGQGRRRRRAEGGDGSALPRPRHGRGARHRLEGRHGRDEVGLT